VNKISCNISFAQSLISREKNFFKQAKKYFKNYICPKLKQAKRNMNLHAIHTGSETYFLMAVYNLNGTWFSNGQTVENNIYFINQIRPD